MTFHEIRFPADLSFGAVGGPERRTEIVTLANGHEERNSPWAASRRKYDAGLGMRTLEDVEAVLSFFEARHGQLHGFRWKDWADYRSGANVSATDQVIGVGDGSSATFQLVKTYRSGAESFERVISKPVDGSVQVAVDGVTVDASVDAATGVVTLDVAPSAGAEVTAGFEFDVPVRFDTDHLRISVAGFEAGEVPSVPVIEVRL